MQRLLGNWPLDEEKTTAKLREFRSLFAEYGEDRFAVAVHNIIRDSQYHYFPTVSEFLGYMPAKEKRQWCGQDGCVEGWVRTDSLTVKPCECRLSANRSAQ